MSLLNRAILVFFALALASGAIAVAVLAWTIPSESIDGLYNAVDWLDENRGDAERGILTGAVAAIVLLAIGIILLEVMPGSASEVSVTDLSGGDAVLSTAAIGHRIEEAVRDVPQVTQVKAGVRTRKKGVIVDLVLHVEPSASLAAVSDQASEATRRVLADKVHVELMEPPHARLYYTEQRRGAAPILQRETLTPAAAALGAGETPPVSPETAPEVKARGRRVVVEQASEEVQ
jgi:hypothetical protein